MEFTPDNVHLLTKQEVNAASVVEWDKLYGAVRRLIGRYDPLDWAHQASIRFRQLKDNPQLMRAMPPHVLLRSIEASAAYWRSNNRYELTSNKFQQIMRIYMAHNDPLLLSFAATDLTAMLILFHREQFELQPNYNLNEAARAWLLFVDGAPLKRTSDAMEKRFRITPLQWLRLSYLVFVYSTQAPNSRMEFDKLTTAVNELMPATSVAAFADLSKRTIDELGKHYNGVRAKTPKQFHSFIRSAFLERPILDFGFGRWMVPEPVLLIHHMGVGLYRLLVEVWREDSSLQHEFAVSIERHVARVLGCCANKVGLHTESAIQELTDQKSCDFILETETNIVLVECKGVAFQRDMLFPKQMQEDASTARLVDAWEQLKQAYVDLQAGRFDTLLHNRNKPIVTLVATFGEIPYVNSDWYVSRVLAPRAEKENRPMIPPAFGLPMRPVVMSLQILEMFITAVNTFNVTPDELLREKESHNQLSVGEWGNYLKVKLRDGDPRWLSYVEPAHARFQASFLPA